MEPIRFDHEHLDDLHVDDFSAVLTLAWGLRRKSNERFLLSSTVDLLPSNEIPDVDEALHRHEVSGSYFAFCRRYVMAGGEGLAWYRRCAAGGLQLPQVERADTALLCERFLPEPPWPRLQCGTSTKVPGSCCESPGRTASQIPSAPGWENRYWSAKERQEAVTFLHGVLSFDFDVDPEYLGAAHVVVADPDLHDVDLSREGPSKDGGVVFRVSAKFRSSAGEGFTFVLHRHRPRGEEAPVVLPLRESTLIELPETPFSFSYDVTHERRGLVYSHGPAVFLDGFSLEAGLTVRARRVKVPSVRQRPEETYDVPLVRDVERVSSGAETTRTAAQMLSANRARSEKRRAPYQKWFDGSADEAAPAIRELLATTKREAFVVDPYFDHVEFLRFGLSVGRVLAPLRILTSAEGLRSTASSTGSPAGAKLLATVKEATSGPGAHASVEIRVMGGVRPEVHDRFVAVDDWVWLLGSSLNEFGSRGTVLVALPDPDPVLDELQAAWDRAVPLENWVVRLKEPVRKNES